MLRQLSVGVIILVCSSSVLSQRPNVPVNETNLYYRALYASLDKMNTDWGKFADDALHTRIPIDYHNIIVEKNSDLTDSLPSQLGAYHVEYLDSRELIDRYKTLRKEFAILVAFPMNNEADMRLRITFNVYWISYKKPRLTFALSDWSSVYFRYDCEKRGYIIDEVKLGGI